MEAISVFNIFKIGVGPSSSHTMGPWRAAEQFLAKLTEGGQFEMIERVQVDLFGSLAKTGKGHGTDIAVMMGLCGEDPETTDTALIDTKIDTINSCRRLRLGGKRTIGFDPVADVCFHFDRALEFHANGLTFSATLAGGARVSETYYSVGGGFVVQEGEVPSGSRAVKLPFPIDIAEQLEGYCETQGKTIPQIVMANELAWRDEAAIRAGLLRIWHTMQACVHLGCHTGGTLPGGLGVVRRASAMNAKLLGLVEGAAALPLNEWMARVRKSAGDFRGILKWVSTFALAVNEENAAFGRVVTAPTNGAAGVIPAVMMYAFCFCEPVIGSDAAMIEFMLTAGEIGSLFKKGATISAAMGGCQAEIGVSSAMAAAGLTQILGGSVGQVLMAAEIAMEHHLGMTCDPIGGLVQVPCIERNTMGAIKAITAANMALENDPANAKVSLDSVIKTMWATAQDMHHKYKETADGGLAVHVDVSVSEC